MPKGALLHAHLEATVDAATLLSLGLEHENMCIRVLEPVASANLNRVLPQFGAQPVAGERAYMKAPTITDTGYVPESWVSARRAREEWPAAMGGLKGFDGWVIKSMVINPEEAYGTHNTTWKIWMKFTSAFTVLNVSLFSSLCCERP
jgi:adenosine deaminase CECR1